MALDGTNILIGVSGGIAAYKSPDLVRRLREAGVDVRVIMTAGGEAFVTPLTLQAVSGHRVRTDLLDAEAEAGMGHIELARWADQVLIAPATANVIARLAAGMADDLLTTVALATEAPVWLAPAMNRVMWASPAVRDNCRVLEKRGVRLLGPDAGSQACGEEGPGRMLEPAEIVAALAATTAGSLTGLRFVVTAGPTREPIDPVRFLGNRSSGRMGFSVAQALAEAGASVDLIAGPVSLATPRGVRRTDVTTAAEMLAAVNRQVEGADGFVAVAAVADYRPEQAQAHKMKKSGQAISLQLVENPDILGTVAGRDPRPYLVGFAAETRDLEAAARDKLGRKGLDLIAANRVGAKDGFEREDNALEVFSRDGRHWSLERDAKIVLARRLVAIIAEQMTHKDPTST